MRGVREWLKQYRSDLIFILAVASVVWAPLPGTRNIMVASQPSITQQGAALVGPSAAGRDSVLRALKTISDQVAALVRLQCATADPQKLSLAGVDCHAR